MLRIVYKWLRIPQRKRTDINARLVVGFYYTFVGLLPAVVPPCAVQCQSFVPRTVCGTKVGDTRKRDFPYYALGIEIEGFMSRSLIINITF